MPEIKLVDLKKQFGTKWVSNGINLTIPANQMTVIIGRSGEGKSVLLKQIIGLIKPTSGQIIMEGTNLLDISEGDLDRFYADIGYVFQFAALLDSLTIFENIGITLLENNAPPPLVLPIVKKILKQVNLDEEVLFKYPSQLSGGMRKRAGLARTLITNPKIILYDEPTTGLDPITAHVIHELMFTMQKQFKLTSVVISHDIEIFKYADMVALLHEGTIKYFGAAKTIWESNNPYIYQFIRGLTQGPIQPDPVHK
jgi:phospholipid/cholesterol/gamma-HCH transport system ATP-binding protein